MASVLLAMTVGMQNVMSFVSDDKARWQKYQMALPVSDMSVVASKYISVLCTLGISLLGAGALNLASSVLYRNFDPVVWGLGAFAAVFLPLMWTGVCLPLTYWFGVQSAQVMGMLIVVPVFYFIKYFEDGSGFSAMAASLSSYLFLAGGCDGCGFRGIPADQRGGICQAEGAAASIAVPTRLIVEASARESVILPSPSIASRNLQTAYHAASRKPFCRFPRFFCRLVSQQPDFACLKFREPMSYGQWPGYRIYLCPKVL